MSARRTAAEDRSEVGGKIDAFVLSVLLDTGHETFDCRRFGQFLRRRRGGARLTDDSRIVYSGTKFENRVDVRLSQSREDECELRPRQDERAIPVDWRYVVPFFDPIEDAVSPPSEAERGPKRLSLLSNLLPFRDFAELSDAGIDDCPRFQ
jgi:hypothetical protein